MKKGERRKQELLKIAYRMFRTRGYDNTSVDEIIEEAGIAKGTYYYYFASKEDMLEEVISMMIDQMAARAEAVLEQDLPVPAKLIGAMMCFRPDESEQAIGDAMHRPENIVMHEKINEKLLERSVPIISKVVEQAVSAGLASCEDIELRVKMIMIIGSRLFQDADNADAEVRVFIDVIEKILNAQPGSMAFVKQLLEKETE
ncbi:MAG: TetR/AcrR family transcriptional regulator [Lachnospiraceae bacterium]|nr:TetR/AcrR family transcriptional regulator [Lachnospiraceae bacterium]